ncbi:hypothetical protein ACFQY0_14750 [Haloferula chungangensis]|uniref:Uncharacterized protein n=2 Tax=Haloferula chungangensis TaxID=1048331 RepID=A0ABW2LCC0_9BACT
MEYDLKNCYATEEAAINAAKDRFCGKCEKAIVGVRYSDNLKSSRRKMADDWYPVDPNNVFDGPFDFGFRQTDGTYIHANHGGQGMMVYHSSRSVFAEEKKEKNPIIPPSSA